MRPDDPLRGRGRNQLADGQPGDPLTKDLLEAIIIAQEKSKLPVNPQGIQELARFAQVGTVALPGQPADTQLDGVIGQGENQQGGSGDNTQGAPIIGVVSRKTGKMFRSYYGIEEYDRALFFPNIPVMAGGFMTPFVLGSVIPGGGGSWRGFLAAVRAWQRTLGVPRAECSSTAGALAGRLRSINDL